MDLLFTVFFWCLVFIFLYILNDKVKNIELENKQLREELDNALLDNTVKQMQLNEFLKDDEKGAIWIFMI